MSIANLFVSNSYDLYCKSLTATSGITVNGDVPIVTQTVDIYDSSNAANIITAGVPVYYVIKNGIATVWMNTTATYTYSFNCSSVNIANATTGYITIPCPAVPGNKMSLNCQIKSNNNSWFRPGFIELDCSVGSVEGQGRLTCYLDPSFTVSPTGPPYTIGKVTGSDSIAGNFGLFGWAISYPVEGLV